ncbi:globin-2 B chain-like [Thrips palmi]|uniref:Globin-2 B chain-like n=1 Tax=Thrips palmi TaxID=161013 RepID=A0A6P8ZTA9_THRPL|nr:globin-2 B chain-like [Thrips palmi]
MGIILSYLWPLSTEVDPVTGLSPKDKHLLTTTWALVKKDAAGNGSHLFRLLFEKHPDVRDMFPFARGKQWAEYSEDARLRAHVSSVMYALTSMVDNLGDVACLDAMVRKLADNHVRRRVTLEHFKALGGILVQTLQDKLGPSIMTAETTTAWARMYDLVLKVLADQMAKPKGSD